MPPAKCTPVEADPNGRDPHTPGAKLDAGKPRVWLCLAGFSRALAAVAEVTTQGAQKYTPNGWQDVPNGEERYMDAFGRHALSLGSGERIDAQTGCLHKAQMVWNLLASLELELRAEAKKSIAPEPPQGKLPLGPQGKGVSVRAPAPPMAFEAFKGALK